MTGCTARTTTDLSKRCGRPDTITVITACVHEHVNTEYLCTSHWPRVQALHRGAPYECLYCRNAGHPCPVTITPETTP